MGQCKLAVSAGEGPEEDEVPTQVGGKRRIQLGRADRPPINLHGRNGI